jgi:hypothetical protein
MKIQEKEQEFLSNQVIFNELQSPSVKALLFITLILSHSLKRS